jgi:hypothetical protein
MVVRRIALLMVLASLVVVPGAEASRDTYQERIEPGYYWYEEYVVWEDAVALLRADIRVVSGSPVNVFLLNEENFDRYGRGETYSYYRGILHEGVREVELEHMFMTRGSYFLMLDLADPYTGEEPSVGSSVTITTVFPWDVDPPRPLRQGELFIPPDEYLVEMWEVGRGMGTARFSLELSVAEGPPVNVYLLDEQNFQRFDRGEFFSSYRLQEFRQVERLDEMFSMTDSGDFYLVFDNAARDGSMSFQGTIVSITTREETSEVPFPGMLLVFVVGILLVMTRTRAAREV